MNFHTGPTTVYIDSSFIDRIADPRKGSAATHRERNISKTWWESYNRRADLVTSPFTFAEAIERYGNARIVRLRHRYFSHIREVRAARKYLNPLAAALLKPDGPIPADEILDAQHIATAAITGCPYLLTWNCRHIANAFNREFVDNIIRRYGYKPLILGNPEEFLAAPPF